MKYVFLLNRKYPYKYGEAFLENEIEELGKYFDKVFIYPSDIKKGSKNTRKIKSDNVSTRLVENFSFKIRKYIYILKIPKYFSQTEKNNCFNKRLVEAYFLAAANSQARKIIGDLKNINITKSDNIYIYSYWLYVNAKVGCILKNYFINKGYNNIRVVSRAHAFDIYEEERKYQYLPQRIELLSDLDLVFPCSNNGTRYLQEKYPHYAKKIITSYLGTYDHGKKDYKEHNSFNIMSCSRLGYFKRVDKIVDILKYLDNKNMNISWTHIGSGDGFEELKNKCKNELININVNLLGTKTNNEVYEYYLSNDVDLFINVSSLEGLPVSIMEAISFGIPVIATNTGGTSEIVDNSNGYLINVDFDEEDVAKLIESLIKLDKKEYLLLRSTSREKWVNTFEAKNNYKKFAERIIGEDDRNEKK